MLAGNIKLKTFLGLAGLGGVALAGMAGLWWSQRPQPPTPREGFADAAGPIPTSTPTSTPTTSTAPALDAGPVAEDSYEDAVMGFVGKDLGTKKKKDALKGHAYKINVYQDEGRATANRAKVDLDRDDRWDEKWTLGDDGSVSRKVSSNDDENYDIEQVWDGSAWRDAS